MRTVLTVLVLVGAAVMAIGGCDDRKSDANGSSAGDHLRNAADKASGAAKDVGAAMKDAAGSAAEKAREAAEATRAKLATEGQALLDRARTEIDALKAKVAASKSDDKVELERSVSDLDSRMARLAERFNEMKDKAGNALSEGWHDFSTAAAKLFEDIKAAAARAG